MYRSTLPSKCPPEKVEEQNKVLYRLFVPDNLPESFKNHVELFPENDKYKINCDAYGISFFDNLSSIKAILQKENNIGKTIAKVEVKKEFGVLTTKGNNRGHYTLWLYKSFNPSEIKYEIVNE